MARDRLLRRHVRDRFVVTLTSGESFSGLLDEHDSNHVTLVDAFTLGDGGQHKVSGSLFIPRDRIAYMQRPAA